MRSARQRLTELCAVEALISRTGEGEARIVELHSAILRVTNKEQARARLLIGLETDEEVLDRVEAALRSSLSGRELVGAMRASLQMLCLSNVMNGEHTASVQSAFEHLSETENLIVNWEDILRDRFLSAPPCGLSDVGCDSPCRSQISVDDFDSALKMGSVRLTPVTFPSPGPDVRRVLDLSSLCERSRRGVPYSPRSFSSKVCSSSPRSASRPFHSPRRLASPSSERSRAHLLLSSPPQGSCRTPLGFVAGLHLCQREAKKPSPLSKAECDSALTTESDFSKEPEREPEGVGCVSRGDAMFQETPDQLQQELRQIELEMRESHLAASRQEATEKAVRSALGGRLASLQAAAAAVHNSSACEVSVREASIFELREELQYFTALTERESAMLSELAASVRTVQYRVVALWPVLAIAACVAEVPPLTHLRLVLLLAMTFMTIFVTLRPYQLRKSAPATPRSVAVATVAMFS